MNQQIKTILAGGLLALALLGPATAGPLEDAEAARQKGNLAAISQLHLPVAENAEAQAYYPTALNIVRPLADQGDAKAQAFLASMYRDGIGMPAATRRRSSGTARPPTKGTPMGSRASATYMLPTSTTCRTIPFRLSRGIARRLIRGTPLRST